MMSLPYHGALPPLPHLPCQFAFLPGFQPMVVTPPWLTCIAPSVPTGNRNSIPHTRFACQFPWCSAPNAHDCAAPSNTSSASASRARTPPGLPWVPLGKAGKLLSCTTAATPSQKCRSRHRCFPSPPGLWLSLRLLGLRPLIPRLADPLWTYDVIVLRWA